MATAQEKDSGQVNMPLILLPFWNSQIPNSQSPVLTRYHITRQPIGQELLPYFNCFHLVPLVCGGALGLLTRVRGLLEHVSISGVAGERLGEQKVYRRGVESPEVKDSERLKCWKCYCSEESENRVSMKMFGTKRHPFPKNCRTSELRISKGAFLSHGHCVCFHDPAESPCREFRWRARNLFACGVVN